MQHYSVSATDAVFIISIPCMMGLVMLMMAFDAMKMLTLVRRWILFIIGTAIIATSLIMAQTHLQTSVPELRNAADAWITMDVGLRGHVLGLLMWATLLSPILLLATVIRLGVHTARRA